MIELWRGSSPALGAWVNDRLPDPIEWGEGLPMLALLRARRVVAATIYAPGPAGVWDMTMATAGGVSLGRRVWRAIFAVPFVELGARLLVAAIAEDNARSRRLAERLGFTVDGRVSDHWPGGRAALVYGMRPDMCRWLT